MATTRLGERALIRISGPETRDFLQGLVTRDLRLVAPGAPQWGGLLTAQGKALFDFILWDDGEAILIDCEASERDALIRRLTLYRLRRPVTIESVAGSVHWTAHGDRGVPDPRLAALGWRWIEEGSEDGAGADDAWRSHRLRFGVVEGVGELGSDKTLWLECNAEELNGVSYDKGCFIGQENTARMHYRNKVNRRLVALPIAQASERVRVSYPDLDLAIDYRRIETLDDVTLPEWLADAIGEAE